MRNLAIMRSWRQHNSRIRAQFDKLSSFPAQQKSTKGQDLSEGRQKKLLLSIVIAKDGISAEMDEVGARERNTRPRLSN